MIHAFVEVSGESIALARSEAISAAEALGGRRGPGEPAFEGLVGVELPDEGSVTRLAARLALAHRCLVLGPQGSSIRGEIAKVGARGESAAVRRVGRPSGPADPAILSAGGAFIEAGGTINLAHPHHRFWLATDQTGSDWLLEEAGSVDRAAVAGRRMPNLPFQRPVSLPPRLARAAANLARVRPGDRVLDPFLGTGALLAEAGLLGARIYGIDRDPTMVRGSLQNFTHLGVTAESLVAGDAGEVEFEEAPPAFDALLSDPPYGRSSTTGGEPADRLVHRVVPRWARHVRPGGRIVLIVPTGVAPLSELGSRVVSVPVRVHRSLTREFRVYEVAS